MKSKLETDAELRVQLFKIEGDYGSTYSAACSMGRPFIKGEHTFIKIGETNVHFGKFDSLPTRKVGEYCGFSGYMTQEKIDKAKPPIYVGEHKGTFYYFNA